jgi:hypothetical protein
MISDIIRVVTAINPNLVLVRTKCDMCDERHNKKVVDVKESDIAKAAQYSSRYSMYAISAHNAQQGKQDVFDWFDLVTEFNTPK